MKSVAVFILLSLLMCLTSCGEFGGNYRKVLVERDTLLAQSQRTEAQLEELKSYVDAISMSLDNIAAEANRLDFYKAGKNEKDLYYLYGVLAFYDFLDARYDSFNLPYPKMKECYDGNNWRYIGFMETGKHRTIRVNWQINSNMDNPGGYRHLVFGNFAGYGNGQMMLASQINACDDILNTF